jgi:hypothetical protein
VRAPVLLVGKSGVGGAIDGYTLNATLFRHAEVLIDPGDANAVNRADILVPTSHTILWF